MKKFFFGVIVFSFQAFSATPQDFVGSFKLLKAKLGSCEDSVQGSFVKRGIAGGDLRVGSFLFTDVNRGEQTMDDDLLKIVSIAFTDAGGAHARIHFLTKATDQKSFTVNRASINGDRLALQSTTTMESPTEPSFSFTTACLYRRTAPSVDPTGED